MQRTHTTSAASSASPTPLWLAYACLALSMALVGSYVALSKPLAAAMPVFLLAWMRFGIGALAMLPWLDKPHDEAPLSGQTHVLLFFESLLGNFLFSICMLFGVSWTSAVSAGVVMAAIPAVVACMAWVFLRERVSGRVGLAIALAVTGIGLLMLFKNEHISYPYQAESVIFGMTKMTLGYSLLIGAVLCEAAYAVMGKRLTLVLSPKRISALINLWGLVLMTPLGLWAAWGVDFAAVTLGTWLLLLFYGLAASVWTVWLWMTGLQTVNAGVAGVFTVMLPVSAALVGVFALGETLALAQWWAMGLALSGLLLATWPRRTV